jgi:magnesium-transporting ATPase (P-type)
MMTFKSKQRSQLSVGDIIIVQKDEEVPADLLLLRAKDNSA